MTDTPRPSFRLGQYADMLEATAAFEGETMTQIIKGMIATRYLLLPSGKRTKELTALASGPIYTQPKRVKPQ